MSDFRICHICDNKMFHTVQDFVYHYKGKEIIVSNISCYKCPCCGEIVYTSNEAKRIEAAIMQQK